MVKNSAGAGLRRPSYKNTMNNDCRKQTPNPGHLGRFRNPSRMHFLGPKEDMSRKKNINIMLKMHKRYWIKSTHNTLQNKVI